MLNTDVMAYHTIEFKQIPNYPDYFLTTDGQVYSVKTGRKLIINKRKKYVLVNLTDEEGKARTHYLHRLVFETFRGKIPKELEINHKDEDKMNNRLENLEAVTHHQNCMYGGRNERISQGLKGLKKKRVKLQVTDGEEVKVYERISDLCAEYKSQKANTWYQRVNAQKEPRLFYQSIENGRVIYISILNITDPNHD